MILLKYRSPRREYNTNLTITTTLHHHFNKSNIFLTILVIICSCDCRTSYKSTHRMVNSTSNGCRNSKVEMNDNKKDKKMHACHCGKAFPQLLELQIHQKIKHKQTNSSENRTAVNFNDTDSSSEESKSIDVKNSQQGSYKDDQKGPSMSQEQPEENPTLAIQPTIDYVEDIDEDKKFFICGCNRRIYQSRDELKKHISKQHLGFPPDGSLFGVSKRLVWNHFRPAVDPPPFSENKHEMSKDAFKFICGCGSRFSCFPALDYHVSKRHKGEQPEGTIGGRKTGPVPNQNAQTHGALSDSQHQVSNSVRSEDHKLICVACDKECGLNSWRCKKCPEWRVCGDCQMGNTSKEKHQKKGHDLYLI